MSPSPRSGRENPWKFLRPIVVAASGQESGNPVFPNRETGIAPNAESFSAFIRNSLLFIVWILSVSCGHGLGRWGFGTLLQPVLNGFARLNANDSFFKKCSASVSLKDSATEPVQEMFLHGFSA